MNLKNNLRRREMFDISLQARSLLVGHDNEVVEKFIRDKIAELEIIDNKNNTMAYSMFSDILLQLYQKTGIDLSYDNLEIYAGYLTVDLRYVDDFETFSLKIGVDIDDR